MDTPAKIGSESLLGGNFVELSPGGSETMIEPGGEIAFTQDPIDIFGLVSQFVLGSNKKSENGSSDGGDAGSGAQQEEPPAEGTSAQ